jgi:hypothetical protein
MKKLVTALILGFLLAPCCAWGQKWIESYTDKDGTQVEGHWQTPDDVRKERYSTPGKINPYTGKFNPYTGSAQEELPPTPEKVTPLNPSPSTQNPYYPPQDYKFQPKDYRYQGK